MLIKRMRKVLFFASIDSIIRENKIIHISSLRLVVEVNNNELKTTTTITILELNVSCEKHLKGQERNQSI